MDIEYTKLSSPSVFLVRMLVFLVLCTLVGVVLYKQIIQAFFANPGLNALIGGVLFIGIVLAFRQVIRLYPEVSWVNNRYRTQRSSVQESPPGGRMSKGHPLARQRISDDDDQYPPEGGGLRA